MGRGVVAASLCVVLGAGLAGCELKDSGDDLVAGKTAFVGKCGSCHTLARAGTQGITGPNLDEAFAQARRDGFGESTFAGMVHRQIENPRAAAQLDPTDPAKRGGAMPADLVTGETAQDVAAYVARVAGKGGEDGGLLASAGQPKSEGTAKVAGGKLDIPAVESGATAYRFADAEAPAGKVLLESVNESTTPHNIAVKGNGLDEKGAVVQGGGASTVEVELEPGEYTFYCSVPGHEAGGMAGKLTVK